MIEEGLYKQILQVLPILCVDIVIEDNNGKYLLVKRRNEPLKGEWWVIGGRIQHQEKAEDAAKRKLFEEAGLNVDELEFMGYYQDEFDCNSFEEGIYHTLSLVYKTTLSEPATVSLDNQSSEWMWADELPERFKILS